ncbi:YdcF family protein [Corynebacterium sp. L4756]|uniref:YdcF family protein n=1 Tax=unclassified Corynebacterium TaxID=2624378 RepID=UPI00374C997F
MKRQHSKSDASNAPIVVLGSRVTDGQPGALLVSRLKKALQIAQRYPQVQVIVSGDGEAPVMARYLLQHGLDPQRVVEEHEATSTNENLERSHALAPDAEFYHVVTNDFHAIRTKLWAWHLKIPITVHPALTPRSHRLRNYSREILATPHSATRIIWRKIRAKF